MLLCLLFSFVVVFGVVCVLREVIVLLAVLGDAILVLNVFRGAIESENYT